LLFAICECRVKIEHPAELDLVICLLVTQAEILITMQHQENQIQRIDVNSVQPDSHPIKNNDLNDLLGSFFIIFGLLMGIEKLWRSIHKLWKQRKFSPKLSLQIVSAIWAIVKAIGQMGSSDVDQNDEE
jgi:hypothetical protein